MKILINPDVHGRTFWVEPCTHIDEFDKVVFLGDYHDPYKYEGITEEQSLVNLTHLVNFYKEHSDKIICLYGNHDANYISTPTADRYDLEHAEQVRELLEQLDLTLMYKIDNYLFSHSGVLAGWLDRNELSLEEAMDLDLDSPKLLQISRNRGGWDMYGSCIWGDAQEFLGAYVPANLYQIFGHTQLKDCAITDTFACLDCRESFVLDTESKKLIKFKEYGKE